MAKKLQLTGFPRFSSPLTYGVSVLLNQIINVTDDDAAKLLALTAQNPNTNVVGPIWTAYAGVDPAAYDLTTESNERNFLDGSLTILPAQLALLTTKPQKGTLLRNRKGVPYGYSDGAGGVLPNAKALLSGVLGVPKRRVATKSFFGRFKNVANGADHTTHAQFTLEAPCDMMRIGVLNGTGVNLTGVKVSLGWLSQTGNKTGVTPNAGTGRDATFAGAASGTILGTVNGVVGTADNPTVTWTDWMSAQSVDRTDTETSFSSLPVHNVRVEIPAANANRTCWHHTDTGGWQDETIASAPYARVLRIRQQAVLAASVANQALFTSTTNAPDGVAFIVQYVPRFRLANTLLVLGNSVDEGASATIAQFGWPYEVQALLSSQAEPMEICMLAPGGGGGVQMGDRAVRMIQEILPSAVYAPAFNTNDTVGTNAQIQASEIDFMRLQFARVQEVCSRLGITLITSTGIPSNASVRAYGATDSLRRAHNEAIRAYFNGSGQPLLDFDPAIAGLTDVNGQVEMLASRTTDGIHPNTAGAKAMAAVALPVLQALFS